VKASAASRSRVAAWSYFLATSHALFRAQRLSDLYHKNNTLQL
jgi:hypothetical protein